MQTIGNHIGERVRQRRKVLGMTQEQLDEASGVPQGSISRIEKGVARDINASTLVGFTKALHVSADYLLGLEDTLSTSTNTSTNSKPTKRRRTSQRKASAKGGNPPRGS